MPRQKPIVVYYVLVFLTSGIFLVYWMYSLMRDVNFVAGRRIFRKGLFTGILAGLFMLNFLSVLYAAIIFRISYPAVPTTGYLVFVVAPAIVVYIIALLIFIDKEIAIISGRDARIGRAVAIILMTVLFYASVPYLQRKVNILLESRS